MGHPSSRAYEAKDKAEKIYRIQDHQYKVGNWNSSERWNLRGVIRVIRIEPWELPIFKGETEEPQLRHEARWKLLRIWKKKWFFTGVKRWNIFKDSSIGNISWFCHPACIQLMSVGYKHTISFGKLLPFTLRPNFWKIFPSSNIHLVWGLCLICLCLFDMPNPPFSYWFMTDHVTKLNPMIIRVFTWEFSNIGYSCDFVTRSRDHTVLKNHQMETKRRETEQRFTITCPDTAAFITGINKFHFSVSRCEYSLFCFLSSYFKKKFSIVYKGVFKSVKY